MVKWRSNEVRLVAMSSGLYPRQRRSLRQWWRLFLRTFGIGQNNGESVRRQGFGQTGQYARVSS